MKMPKPELLKVRYYYSGCNVKQAAAASALADAGDVHLHSKNAIKGFCSALGMSASTFDEDGNVTWNYYEEGA